MFSYLFLFEWAADKEQHGKDIEYDALYEDRHYNGIACYSCHEF